MQKIDATQLRDMMGSDQDLVVVDTLPEEKYQQQHIPSAHSVPLGEDDDFADRVEEIAGDKTTPVVVYCANTECDLSPAAAHKLEAEGFENVYDFEGGIEAWKNAGLETETGAGATA